MKKHHFLIGLLAGIGLISLAWGVSFILSNQNKVTQPIQLQLDEVSSANLKSLIEAEVRLQITDSTVDQENIESLIKNIVRMENSKNPYKPYIILAESGFSKMEVTPEIGQLKKVQDDKIPEDYEIYNEFIDEGMENNIYVMIKKPLLMGDIMVGGIEEEWYGPF